METTKENGESEALAQLRSLREMVSEARSDDDEERERGIERIMEDPLSVEVRSGWVSPGTEMEATEFCILLCSGGPAVRIVGTLGPYSEPDTARVEYQDWFQPWAVLALTNENEQYVLAYASLFCFGD